MQHPHETLHRIGTLQELCNGLLHCRMSSIKCQAKPQLGTQRSPFLHKH